MASPQLLNLGDQELAWSAIARVIQQVPAYHIFRWRILPFLAGAGQPETGIQHNAALDSTLVRIRALNELAKPGGMGDDIRLSLLLKEPMTPFLTKDEESAINKFIAHLTVRQLNPNESWLLDQMTAKALIFGFDLLGIVIDQKFPFTNGHILQEVIGVRRRTGDVLKMIDQENGGNHLAKLIEKAQGITAER